MIPIVSKSVVEKCSDGARDTAILHERTLLLDLKLVAESVDAWNGEGLATGPSIEYTFKEKKLVRIFLIAAFLDV